MHCSFPPSGTRVDLAVSGGADSVGLTLLALAHGLRPTIHHVDHHLRATSGDDAALVAALAKNLSLPFELHDVVVDPGGNLEARARAARRAVLPHKVFTGHTMDDQAETIVLNMMRGAALDGLAPMVHDPTKPLVGVRRSAVLAIVRDSSQPFVIDSSNSDQTLRRNRVRLTTLPALNEVAERDLVPVLARQAALIGDELAWLNDRSAPDALRPVSEPDCRELLQWPTARLRRWLRVVLASPDDGDGSHPPSLDEINRVISVVSGEVVATELSGHRRVARRDQRLRLENTQPLRSTR